MEVTNFYNYGTMNQVEPGATQINNYYGSEKPEEEPDVNDNLNDVPEVLAESELWQRVKDAGLVNENNQPTVSRTEAALLADMLAEKLGIRNKWKMFETLWQRNNMRGDFNTALGQNKSLAFQDKLKKLLR